jgi:hypothetical protein
MPKSVIFTVPSGGEQQVAGLDIPVNQPRRVRRLQPGRGLRDDIHRPHRIRRPAGQHLGQ